MQADIIHKALSVEDIIKRTFVGNDASFHRDSKEQDYLNRINQINM